MFIGLVILALGAAVAYGADRAIDTVLQSDTESVGQVANPTPNVVVPEPVNVEAAEESAEAEAVDEEEFVEESAEAEIAELGPSLDLMEEYATEDEAAPIAPADPTMYHATEDEAAPIAPADPTMYLSIPKLGLSNVTVLDDVSEEGGLMAGAGHLPGTGFPWIPGSNTYIAGHRIGYPGTPSDHIFFNLPSLGPGDEITLTDSLGQTYTYQVYEVLEVDLANLGVTSPVGNDIVSLQVCIENYGDYATLGPNWNVRLIVRGERVA
ncbi:MAG: class E sortase [Actinomycetota bacterium]|nr:class E sortase [Actinomycetota bacterium]